MADTAQLCPWTRNSILTAILSSAKAAVETCTGGDNGRMCGMRWGLRQFDGEINLGQETGVLSALMTALLLADTVDENADYGGDSNLDGLGFKPPLTKDTGGTSIGDPQAGQSRREKAIELLSIEEVDTIFAVTLTTVVLVGVMVMFVWMGIDDIGQQKRNLQKRVRLGRYIMDDKSSEGHRQTRPVGRCQEGLSQDTVPRTYQKYTHHSVGVA